MTFSVITLGCKVNSCESAAIENSLAESGFSPAEGKAADICVVNSCAVTGMSVKKARQTLSRCKKDNPDCITVLCGCYPQAYAEEASTLGADIVVGNSNKGDIAGLVQSYISQKIRCMKVGAMSREFDEDIAAADMDRTRAFIKIQDGCDRFCTYCIIPMTRGRARSRSPQKIHEQAVLCAESGHKEIVLTGINLGCYGQELGLSLADAVEAAAADGIERIRLGSLEPDMLTAEEIARLKAVPQLCAHFHLSLQSGCDDTLRRMNRRYDTEYYRTVVEMLRKEFPECSITTDIMVGFAGETDEEFRQSMEFAKEIGFAKIHVFPYSIREGTVAAARSDHVVPHVKTARAKQMDALAKQLEHSFLQQQVGTTHTVLIEKRSSDEYCNGFTESYIPVRVYHEDIPRHSLVKVMITAARDDYCIGRVIQ